MPHTYTIAYSVQATNVSAAALAAAFTALPRDTDTEALLGLSVAPGNDTVTTLGDLVTRTILYDSAPGPLGDPYTEDALANLYTLAFSRGLGSYVVAAPVVFA